MESRADRPTVVLDTNLFVAGGFNPRSCSRRILELVRQGELDMAWSPATRDETRLILTRIPRLKWTDYAELFGETWCFKGELDCHRYSFVPDPDDRKFAALAVLTDSILVTSDRLLLASGRELPQLRVTSPSAFWDSLSAAE